MSNDYLAELFSVQDKVIAITGGGGILCGAMADALARAGARILVMDYNPAKAQAVVDRITQAGGQAMALEVNCLDKANVEAALARALEAYGCVDALINGAGGNRKEATTSAELPFFDLPLDTFMSVFDLNFKTALICCQVFGKHMAERGEGSIINIASINAIKPLTNIPAYSAAKAAVRNFTEWLAVHISHNYSPRIRVNAIAPGFYLTEQNRYLMTVEGTGELTARGQSVVGHTPMHRLGDPQELLSTIFWLLAPGSAFVHGTTTVVDGGFAAFSGV
ncbi:MAG: SDR family oxidoreductase [Chloroflexi bacterium]|nr:SDR family oxidoreductase [Chloroflexota bacterium]